MKPISRKRLLAALIGAGFGLLVTTVIILFLGALVFAGETFGPIGVIVTLIVLIVLLFAIGAALDVKDEGDE